jgi:Lrp/AsnC family transcriptional regulator, leucine-responsive regulatory protein
VKKGPAKLDEIDARILRELQFNARITNADLAERVNLSPSPCWNRWRRLETEGILEKYVTVLNQRAVGIPDSVIVEIRLKQHDEESLKHFEEAVRRLPEVVEAFQVTGDYDYHLRIATSGTDGYERFLREKINKLPSISHTRSSFTLRCLKQTYSCGVPEDHRSQEPT